jgi:hypothetical protein
MRAIAPDAVRGARGAIVMGMTWAALGCLGVHAAQAGAGGELASSLGSFAGLLRLLGVAMVAGAGLDLLVEALGRGRRRGGGGSHVAAGRVGSSGGPHGARVGRVGRMRTSRRSSKRSREPSRRAPRMGSAF